MESLRGIHLELHGGPQGDWDETGHRGGIVPSWSKHEALRRWLPHSGASAAPGDAVKGLKGAPGSDAIPELQRLRAALVQRFGSLELAFEAADFFPSKMISCVELEEFVCSELRCGLGRHEVSRIFRVLDENKDGRISHAELLGLGARMTAESEPPNSNGPDHA